MRREPKATEGAHKQGRNAPDVQRVTGSHQNWRRGETRAGAALKETTKHTGKGNSNGPTGEQRGPAARKTQNKQQQPHRKEVQHKSAVARRDPPSSMAINHHSRRQPACAARQPPRGPKPKQAVKTAQKQSVPKASHRAQGKGEGRKAKRVRSPLV